MEEKAEGWASNTVNRLEQKEQIQRCELQCVKHSRHSRGRQSLIKATGVPRASNGILRPSDQTVSLAIILIGMQKADAVQLSLPPSKRPLQLKHISTMEYSICLKNNPWKHRCQTEMMYLLYIFANKVIAACHVFWGIHIKLHRLSAWNSKLKIRGFVCPMCVYRQSFHNMYGISLCLHLSDYHSGF